MAWLLLLRGYGFGICFNWFPVRNYGFWIRYFWFPVRNYTSRRSNPLSDYTLFCAMGYLHVVINVWNVKTTHFFQRRTLLQEITHINPGSSWECKCDTNVYVTTTQRNSPWVARPQLTCEYRSERRVVTSHSHQMLYEFAFAGSMNRA